MRVLRRSVKPKSAKRYGAPFGGGSDPSSPPPRKEAGLVFPPGLALIHNDAITSLMADGAPLIVQKYGGSSLATPAHIQRAARRIRKVRESGKQVVVVASAMGRMTDHLIRLAHRTVKTPPQREMDMLLSTGERISMSLLAMALEAEGVRAISFTGSQSGILTTSDHTSARIKTIKPFRTQEELAKGKVVIIAGFQGVSENKEITTLGRGGSDTTAIALAAALNAEYCEILTDVDGLFTADPRLVNEARLIQHCSYDEGLELATLGAKMHPRSLEVARRYQVPVWIGPASKMLSPDAALGTWITDDRKGTDTLETVQIKGIASLGEHTLFEINGRAQVVLETAQSLRIVLKHWHQENNRLLFVCDQTRAGLLVESLEKNGVEVKSQKNCALLSAVGEGLGSCPDLLPQFLSALSEVGVTPLWIGRSALTLTAVIDEKQKALGVKKLHETFVENRLGSLADLAAYAAVALDRAAEKKEAPITL